ncbi:MAG: BBP7 family outer membrane beta-barrel protein [Pirellulaceae bacterium]|nr:BBP7 family outer membrane beta-barrel protein [Pirellulaceae bacterium]
MNARLIRFPISTGLVIGCLLSLSTDVDAQRSRSNPLRGQSTAAEPAEFTDAQLNSASFLDDNPDADYVPVSEHGYCDSCGDTSCSGCDKECLAVWGSIEYLLWWGQDAKTPPLVTTSPVGTSYNDAGVLGEPTTSVLFGGDIQSDAFQGGRLTVGLWLDSCAKLGVAGRGFSMQQNTSKYSADSNAIPILARPFFDAITNVESSRVVGFPLVAEGNMNVALETEIDGVQAFLRHQFKRGCNYRIDWLLGYRYLGMRESLLITDSTINLDTGSPFFDYETSQIDFFDVENEFNGAEIGLMGHSVEGRWTLDFHSTVSLGEMQQLARVNGSTVIRPPTGTPTELVGGLLTQGTNIGEYRNNQFAVIPEVSLTLGYFITPRLDLSIGYTFLYVNHLSRPGQLIDTDINLTQQTGTLEGPARPEFVFRDSDYWLQGMNFGLNLRY